jgi:hypothetical protein
MLMTLSSRFLIAGGLLVLAGLCVLPATWGQNGPPGDDAPPVPKGVEVLARGPVHEAFATPTSEPQATKPVPKQPPRPLEEMPPDERPDGDVIWVPGYWSWDEERNDFLWVSGIWRTQPPGRQWVAGYWNQTADGWQYVSGFWNQVVQERPADVTYLPPPPPPPNAAPPGAPPMADTFFVPGHWQWNGNNYVWRAGYWARVQPGYVWVPAHYRWTPSGYIYIAGYWDLAVTRRGVLYAPVYVDTAVVGATFVYTPAYAVHDTVVLDSLFVRPAYGVYYFGDYYGPRYASVGFVSCYTYSRTNYDSIIVYERWENRRNPAWFDARITLTFDRDAGRAPLPPRTLVQQNTIVQQTVINNNNTIINNNVVNNNTQINKTTNNNVVNNNTSINNTTQVLAPTSKVVAARGAQTVKVDPATRVQVRDQARQVTQAAVQARQQTERAGGGPPTTARTASLNLPKAQPLAARTSPTNAASGTTHPNNLTPAANTNPAGNKFAMPANTQKPNFQGATANPNNAAVGKAGVANPFPGANPNNPGAPSKNGAVAGKGQPPRPGQPNGQGRPPGVNGQPGNQRPMPPGQNQQNNQKKDKQTNNPPS